MAKRLGWACYIFSVVLAALVLLFPTHKLARHVEALVAETLPGWRLQAIAPALIFPPALALQEARLTAAGRLVIELENVRLRPTFDFPPHIKLAGGGDDRVFALIRRNKAGDAVSVAFTLRDLPAFALPLAEKGVEMDVVPGIRVLARIAGDWNASGRVDLQDPASGKAEIAGTGLELGFVPAFAGVSDLSFSRVRAGGRMRGGQLYLDSVTAKGEAVSVAVSGSVFLGTHPDQIQLDLTGEIRLSEAFAQTLSARLPLAQNRRISFAVSGTAQSPRPVITAMGP